MSRTLNISSDLSLPVDAATQTFAFIGRKGSGKTYGAGKMVEELLAASVQTLILDTVGNWYGLRLGASGKGKGFDVPIFGGLRCDVPLNPAAGEMVADVAVDTGRSMILDVSQFSKGDRKHFATAFGEHLWKRKKAETHPTPIHLVLEECQLIIPQNFNSGDARMVGIYEEIVRLGRNYGIGVSMITQRPQSVNKEALTQTECLIVFQVNGVPERKALKEWITYQGMDAHLLDALPSMEVGTAYVWSPQWLNILKKIRIAPKKTFDASSTPKVGVRQERRDPAPLDLQELQQRMASLIEEAKANDPKALKAELAKARAELARAQQAKPVPAPKVETKIVEKPAMTDHQLARAEKIVQQFEGLLPKMSEAVAQIAAARQKVVQWQSPTAPAPIAAAPLRPAVAKVAKPRPAPVSADGFQPTAAQRRILNAMAWWESIGVTSPSRAQVGFVARIKPTGGHFSNSIGPLGTHGLIEAVGDGQVHLTEQGRALAETPAMPPTLEEYQGAIRSILATSAQQRIFDAIAAGGGGALDTGMIGEVTGINVTGGHFANSIGPLSTLGLIDRRGGVVRPTELMFPPGLR